MLYRLQGGKEEALALYGAAFTLCSFRTTFLLLAILNPINPERATRERLGGSTVTGSEQQAPGCSAPGAGRLGKGGSKGASGGEGFPAGEHPPSTSALLFCCCLAAGLGVQPEPVRAPQQHHQHCIFCFGEGTGRSSPEKGETLFIGKMWRPGLVPLATPSPTISSLVPL